MCNYKLGKNQCQPLTVDKKAQVLRDERKNGKCVDWRQKKISSIRLADSLARIGQERKADRVYACAHTIFFIKDEDGKNKYRGATFCEVRLCPMCEWRMATRRSKELLKTLNSVETNAPDLVPLLLTLTVKNCPVSEKELKKTLDAMFSGFKRLFDDRTVSSIIQGWYRTLEITYDKTRNELHPHFHVLLLVNKNYFCKAKNDNYLTTADWVKLWRRACRLDYDPICDIRRFRSQKGKAKAISELAKYVVKDKQILQDEDEERTDCLVRVLTGCLKNRRLVAYGGILRHVYRHLFGEKAKMEGTTESTHWYNLRTEAAETIVRYRWSFGAMNYFEIDDSKNSLERRNFRFILDKNNIPKKKTGP